MQIKLILMGVVGLIAISGVGYHKFKVNSLKAEVAEAKSVLAEYKVLYTELESAMKEQINQVEICNRNAELLVQANSNLVEANSSKDHQNNICLKQVKDINRINAKFEADLENLNSTLLKSNRKEREKEILMNDRSAKLYLRIINKNVKCFQDHFYKFTGECRSGKWVPYKPLIH